MTTKLMSLIVDLINLLIKMHFNGLKEHTVLFTDLSYFFDPPFVDTIWIFYYQSYFSQSETKAGFYELFPCPIIK